MRGKEILLYLSPGSAAVQTMTLSFYFQKFTVTKEILVTVSISSFIMDTKAFLCFHLWPKNVQISKF